MQKPSTGTTREGGREALLRHVSKFLSAAD